MTQCTGNCNCCACLLRPTSIVEKNGITTITVADDTLTDLCRGQKVCFGLFQTIPATSKCNKIEATDGTTTLTIYNSGRCQGQPCNQHWRPCELICRSVISTTYLDDPDVLSLNKVKGRCY